MFSLTFNVNRPFGAIFECSRVICCLSQQFSALCTGDSSQPLQLWVSLGISTKGKSGLLATGEVSAPNESVGETAFEDDLEQMESDEGAVRSSLKSSIDSAEVQMVNEDKQRKKAKKKKKKSHKRGPTLEKDSIASSTESHKGGDGGMDVSFPLSALKGSWKKTKQTSSSKVGGKDLKRMMQQDEEDVEESVQTPIQVTSGKRLRYWSEESDGVSKEKRLCEESPDEEDEGTIGGLEIDAPEKEEYSPVFIGACACVCVYVHAYVRACMHACVCACKCMHACLCIVHKVYLQYVCTRCPCSGDDV